MGLRDLLVHKWQHPDARVRVSALSLLKGKSGEAVLKRLAVEDPSQAVRKAAAVALSADSYAELIDSTADESKRLALVFGCPHAEQLQEMLLRIALLDASGYVRGAAVQKLTRDDLLFNAAMSEMASEIGLVAVQRMTDLYCVRRVAEESAKPAIRREAVHRLNREEHLDELIKFARDDVDDWVKEEALSRLHWADCPSLFTNLATAEGAVRLRIAAIKQIDIQEGGDLVRSLAAEDSDPRIRKTAIGRLSYDQDFPLLLRAAERDEDAAVRRAAVEQLDLEKIRLRISKMGKRDPDPHVRKAAAQKAAPKTAALNTNTENSFTIHDLDLAKWQLALSQAAASAPDPAVREAALFVLDASVHPERTAEIAKKDKNPNVRRAAVMKLEPSRWKKLLLAILEKDKDARVRRAAEYKLSFLK